MTSLTTATTAAAAAAAVLLPLVVRANGFSGCQHPRAYQRTLQLPSKLCQIVEPLLLQPVPFAPAFTVAAAATAAATAAASPIPAAAAAAAAAVGFDLKPGLEG